MTIDLRMMPFLAVALLGAKPLSAAPVQGVLTPAGTLSILCKATDEKDESGKAELAFSFEIDGKGFATGSACDTNSGRSMSAFAMVPDSAGAPQPAIFNDGAFTDLHFEQRDSAGTVMLVSVRVERDDPPIAIRWPGMLKPISINYAGRDLVTIGFKIDRSAMLPALGDKDSPDIVCSGQLSWATRKVISFVTDTARTPAKQSHYCEDTFGWLTGAMTK